MSRLFLLLLVVFATTFATARPAGNAEGRYISQPYLSNLEVNAFGQDDAGYIWIATQGGLYRYNGYDFRYYYCDPQDSLALSSNHVYDVMFDRGEECLWVANENMIVRLSTVDGKIGKYPSLFGMAHYGLMCHNGNIVAYGSAGINVLDPAEGVTQHAYDPGRAVNTVECDSAGNIWLGMEETNILLCLGPDYSEAGYVVLPEVTSFTCSHYFDDRNIWFGTRHGLVVLDAVENCIAELPLTDAGRRLAAGLDITTIGPVSENIMAVGTLDGGIFLYDIEENTLFHSSLSPYFTELGSPYVRSSFRDRDGNIWVGTSNSGFHIEPAYRTQFNPDATLVQVTADRLVKSVTEDRYGRMWIAARYGGLVCYDPAAKKTVPYRGGRYVDADSHLLHDIRYLFCDSENRLWCGYTWGYAVFSIAPEGLVLLKRDRRESEVVCFEEDGLGRVWMGTDRNGITVISRDLASENNYSPRGRVRTNITRILRQSNGMMLVASFSDDVYIVDPVSMGETLLAEGYDLSNRLQTAVTLFEDTRGFIWIGTYNNGLLKYDPAGKSLDGFSTNTGLPSNDVLSIEEDSRGRLWAGTSNGISLYDPETDRFVNYYSNDGTGGDQYYEKAVYKSGDGELFFGAIHGLTQFHPLQIENHHPPLTVVLDILNTFTRGSQPGGGGRRTWMLGSSDGVRLRSSENLFSIEFAALEYNSPEKIDYAFMLEGFDADWNYVGKQRRATYSRVPPGEYVFRVRASNGNNIWSDEATSLTLSVIPSFWQTGWAKFLYVLLTVALVYFAGRFFVRLKISKEKIILAEKQYRQEKMLSDMRIRFFTNISHELKTPLTLIYSPINELLHDGGVAEPKKTLYYLSLVQNNVTRLIKLIDQLLDYERLENDTLSLRVSQCDIVPYLQTITEGFCYYAQEKNISMHIDCPYDSLKLPVDADKIEKVLINLISNALKYTSDNGNIWIEARATRYPDPSFGVEDTNIQYLQINVLDDGAGIPEEDLPMLFERYRRFENKKSGGLSGTGIGLYYVKRLVEVHGGRIYARNRLQGGMVFSFIIPLDPGKCDITLNQGRENIDINSPDINPPHASSHHPAVFAAEDDEQDTLDTVLVVDDNAELRLFLKSAMAGRYNVVVASDGNEGYAKAEEIVPDIIVSDVMMPGKDGLDLCSSLKGNVNTSHIPVVLLTAKTETSNQIKGYAHGADMYLSKPFETNLLFSILDNLLLKHKRQKAQILGITPVKTLSDVENLSPLDRKFLEKFYSFIEENLSNEELNVNVLSRNLGLSRTSLYRKIKALTGKSPNDFLRIYRLNRSAELIREGELMLNEIAEKTGFGTHSHFSTCFKKQFGVSPRDFV